MANKLSTNMPRPPAGQNLSESTKIKPSFTKTSTTFPSNTAAKDKSAPSTMPKGSPNPGAALSKTNIKSTFGTPKKQK